MTLSDEDPSAGAAPAPSSVPSPVVGSTLIGLDSVDVVDGGGGGVDGSILIGTGVEEEGRARSSVDGGEEVTFEMIRTLQIDRQREEGMFSSNSKRHATPFQAE